MPNTTRGIAQIPLFANTGLRFDQIASMIQAGSAIGYGIEAAPAPSGFPLASVAFPRAASLFQANPANPTAAQYQWDSLVFRSSATSMLWLPDPLRGSAPANASVGIPMFGNDPKPLAFPGITSDFTAFAVGAGSLAMVFLQGDDLSL